jgi:hypothetical protein
MSNETKLTDINGVELLSADIINNTGIAKAYFSTRKGGVSTGENGSMNLNLFKPNDRDNSDENFRIFCSAIDISPQSLVLGREKHTNNVRIVDRDYIRPDFFNRDNVYEHFDGQITTDNEITLFVYSSDCAVFLILDPAKKVIATLHAGWRGSLNGIIAKTVSKMTAFYGTNPTDLIVATGPNIRQCCFEVDEPVKNEFLEFDSSLEKFICAEKEKYHIDLDSINTELFIRLGVKFENIALNTHCTMCEDDLFHSFRRHKGINGVNGAVIKLV